jgi:hypothetical protein
LSRSTFVDDAIRSMERSTFGAVDLYGRPYVDRRGLAEACSRSRRFAELRSACYILAVRIAELRSAYYISACYVRLSVIMARDVEVEAVCGALSK